MSRRLSSESSSCDEESLAKYSQFSSPTKISSPTKRQRADDEDGDDSPPKKISTGYSSVAQRMMARMGHEQGKGLGSTIKGIVEPIMPEVRMGKRGLGFSLPGFEPTGDNYEELEEGKFEEANIKEKPVWAPSCAEPIPTGEELMTWIHTGPLKLEIADEAHFCEGAILRNVLAAKSAFDRLETIEFLKARTRSNPYELIKNGIFQNRAAMKMANMDKIFDYMFTYPKKRDGSELVSKQDLLCFADICSGPGGFSEYVLWRRRQDLAKGFGFTLKTGPGVNDFKLDDFYSAPVEFLEPHYGVDGAQGDGNIMDSENINAFRDFVHDSTEGHGVHFVMGDGGFSVTGQENIQELLTKQLVLCQFCMAFSILRPGGNFVCKIFDIFTPFTVGLFYLLWRCFDQVALCKPLTSRPANSERYVVCKGLREGADVVYDYLFILNVRFNEMKAGGRQTEDIIEVVPLDVMKETKDFSSYVTEFNETFGRAQVNALRRLAAYVRNSNLCFPNQAQIRRDCLAEWKVPDEVRAAPQRVPAAQKIDELGAGREMQSFYSSMQSPLELSKIEVLDHNVTSLDDWHCYLSCGQRMVLLGLGRSNVFALNKASRGGWFKDPQITRLALPANTLIEVEVVEELRGEGKGQRRSPTVYITDAMFICGKDVRSRHHNQRLQLADKLARALRSPSRTDLMVMRVNYPVKLPQLPDLFQRMTMMKVKGRSQERLAFQVSEDDNAFVCPDGLIFMRHIRTPWSSGFSKSARRPYFFNPSLKKSVFELPVEAVADYNSCSDSRYLWPWHCDDTQLQHELISPTSADNQLGSALTKSSLLNFIASKRSH